MLSLAGFTGASSLAPVADIAVTGYSCRARACREALDYRFANCPELPTQDVIAELEVVKAVSSKKANEMLELRAGHRKAMSEAAEKFAGEREAWAGERESMRKKINGLELALNQAKDSVSTSPGGGAGVPRSPGGGGGPSSSPGGVGYGGVGGDFLGSDALGGGGGGRWGGDAFASRDGHMSDVRRQDGQIAALRSRYEVTA